MSSFHYEGQGVWVSYEENSEMGDDMSLCSSSSAVSGNENHLTPSKAETEDIAQTTHIPHHNMGGKHPLAHSTYQYLEDDGYDSDSTMHSDSDSEPGNCEISFSPKPLDLINAQEAYNSFERMPHDKSELLKPAYAYRFSGTLDKSKSGGCPFLKELQVQHNANDIDSRQRQWRELKNMQVQQWLEERKYDGMHFDSDDESDSSDSIFGRESSQSIMKRIKDAAHERKFLSSIHQSKGTPFPERTLKRKHPRDTLQVPNKAPKGHPAEKKTKTKAPPRPKLKVQAQPKHKPKVKEPKPAKIKKEKPKPIKKDPEYPLPEIPDNVIVIQIDRKEHSKVQRWEKAYTPKEENFIMWAINHPDGPMSWEWIAKMIFPFSGRPNKDDPEDPHEYRVYRTGHSVRVRWTDNITKGKYVNPIVKDKEFIMRNYREFYEAYPLEVSNPENEEA